MTLQQIFQYVNWSSCNFRVYRQGSE